MIPRLHLVSDDVVLQQTGFPATALELATVLGARVAIHIRSHTQPAAAIFAIAQPLISTSTGAHIIINDRIDIALACDADGVQLGVRSIPVARARSLPGAKRIGYSAHAAAEAAQAAADGADWIFAGSIFRTTSHPDKMPAGPGLVREIARQTTVPVIAIGGITPERLPEVRAAGAYGVAVIRAVWHAARPVQAAQEFANMLYHDDAD